jgi:hypothetical protein
MANQFNVDQLRLDIESLIREFPDLAEDQMLRADMLDGETDIKSVLTELFRTADDSKLMVAALAARVAELNERKSRLARRVEFLRGLILKVLQSADLKRFELPEATLSQRRGQPQIIGEPNVEELPRELLRITVEPDRNKIRDALIAGQAVPGVVLSNAPPSLSVNVK